MSGGRGIPPAAGPRTPDSALRTPDAVPRGIVWDIRKRLLVTHPTDYQDIIATLVLDSISFVDTTWFGRGGLFHSANLHIVEKFTRTGNEMLYEITLEDPDVLVEPWVMPPRTLRLNGAADAGLVPERAYCEVYEQGNITNQLRH